MTSWRGLVVPALAILLWEVALHGARTESDTIVAPSAVLASLWQLSSDGTLLRTTFETLAASCLGLAAGFGTGLLAGILLGSFPRAAAYLSTPIELIRPIPSVALIPLSLMACGFGLSMEAAIVAFATFWPSLILSHTAIATIDIRLVEVARLLRLGPIARVSKILLPAALPRILTALRLAIGLALVVAVTVEIAANPQGLGYALIIAQQALRPGDMLAVLIWVGILGWGLNAFLVVLERRLSSGQIQATSEI
ncbi:MULTISPECIES: ABC transporter permease [unclassified Bradyrhizobium]|uniref:ABC transporter permease n=1 Tax=unclassified Bradyrhizobium TaxID=2631580 RepID=UPI002305E307|nr:MULTISPECIES: ABC transporter permease [unclassified Bradyrhizobium]MDA9451240.1 hypothetical protein [Bradyrhizobium sp. CCBAU 21360]MDA9457619.1 hypothetical protein [Bradyrhizobium sp. CCBAU 21359]